MPDRNIEVVTTYRRDGKITSIVTNQMRMIENEEELTRYIVLMGFESFEDFEKEIGISPEQAYLLKYVEV